MKSLFHAETSANQADYCPIGSERDGNLPSSCKSRAPAAVNCFAIEPVRNLVAVEFLTFNSASAQPHAWEKIVAPFRDSAATRMNVFDWHALEK